MRIRVRVKGLTFGINGTPIDTMSDMLRHDDALVESLWDYPSERQWRNAPVRVQVPFTAIVNMEEVNYTKGRWSSFGLVTDILGEHGPGSISGWNVRTQEEWEAR